MTDNQQRAATTVAAWTTGSKPWSALSNFVAAALDAAEQRGRDEVAAKVRLLADHIQALDVSHVKAPGLVARLRAIAPDLDEDES